MLHMNSFKFDLKYRKIVCKLFAFLEKACDWNGVFLIFLLWVFCSSCGINSTKVTGDRMQKAAIQGAAGQRYSYKKSLYYDTKSKMYILNGSSCVTSLNPNAEPQSIFNSFKCYFKKSRGRWFARPAKKKEADSTLISGELLLSGESGIAEIINAKLAPFNTYAPTIEPNGKIIIGQEIEVIVFEK